VANASAGVVSCVQGLLHRQLHTSPCNRGWKRARHDQLYFFHHSTSIAHYTPPSHATTNATIALRPVSHTVPKYQVDEYSMYISINLPPTPPSSSTLVTTTLIHACFFGLCSPFSHSLVFFLRFYALCCLFPSPPIRLPTCFLSLYQLTNLSFGLRALTDLLSLCRMIVVLLSSAKMETLMITVI
jgi:hypothetical protein